ncbi:MAG: Ig-like domain-containing protein, partial [Pseudomonadales bacterium]
ENFSDSFTYTVSDGINTDTATVTITINPVNDNTPVAEAESFTLNEGATATQADLDDAGSSLLDGDTDEDLPNDTLVVSAVNGVGGNVGAATATSFGTVTVQSDGTFSYTHDDTENFSDSFTYTVADAVGNTDTATVTITINPVNDNTPVAEAESFTLNEGATATQADLDDAGSSLLDGDTDEDLPNDTLVVSAVNGVGGNVGAATATSFGTVTVQSDGTFSYTHDDTENFSDSFTYTVADAVGNTDTATVTITINPVNDNPPVAAGNAFEVDEGATATEADLASVGKNLLQGLTDDDLPDDSHTVNATPVSGPSNAASFTLNTDGTFSYTHDDSEVFSDQFTFEVIDAAGQTDTATVIITINETNDNAPVAQDNSFTVVEGASADETNLDTGANLLQGLTDVDTTDSHTVNTTPVVDVTF